MFTNIKYFTLLKMSFSQDLSESPHDPFPCPTLFFPCHMMFYVFVFIFYFASFLLEYTNHKVRKLCLSSSPLYIQYLELYPAHI